MRKPEIKGSILIVFLDVFEYDSASKLSGSDILLEEFRNSSSPKEKWI